MSFDRNNEDIDKTVAAFDSVVKKIESKNYSMNCRPVKVCGDCDFKGYCNNTWDRKV